MRRLSWLLLCLLPFSIFAAPPVYLTGVDIQPAQSNSKFTFILSKKTAGHVKYLADQHQVLIDFDDTVNHFTMRHAWLGDANVKTIDTLNLSGKLRFILTIKGYIKYKVSYVPNITSGARLQLEIISILPNGEDVKAAFIRDLINIHNTTLVLDAEKKPHVFTVMIDAGHGGKDSGAVGINGTFEKNVALAIAKMLALEINREPNMRAVLTRSGDYFLPLRERMDMARKSKADLFVAIHADAHYDPQAEGVSVFALSQHGATSEAARWLAQRENYSELDNVELNSLEDNSIILRSVLIDLAQTVTIQDSLHLGHSVLNALDNISTLHCKRVEQAPFVVLKSPDVPSILVETGFITNPREEKRLTSKVYQHQVAFALQQGIDQYVRNVADEQQ